MKSSRSKPARGGGRRGSARPRPRRETAAIEPLHPTAEPPDIGSFRHWDLAPEVQDVIEAMGISTPTPIQRLAIQPVLDGRDVIAKAETGTGKTLAFGAPILSRIDAGRATVLALVLCPTRELAQQVCGVLTRLGAAREVRTALVVGGEPMNAQIDALKAGAQVVVGTPGRVLDLYGQGFLAFPWTEFVVLDEADEMLEIGFLDDVRKILSYTPDERQTLHFSATFPRDVLQLARESTRDPVEVATARGVATVATIEQSFIRVAEEERPRALRTLIESGEADDVFLVFCDRRTEVDKLMRVMERMPFPTKALHGGFDQASRFRVMGAFRAGEVKALVATDVAARGLDVAHVTHVVNFSVPQDVQDYTHRIGRTGRAGRAGKAITLVTPRSERRWRALLDAAPWEVPQAQLPQGGGGRRPRRVAGPREGPAEERPHGQRPRREQPERGRVRERDRAPEEVRPRRKESTRQRLERERGENQGDRAAGPGARPRREHPARATQRRPARRAERKAGGEAPVAHPAHPTHPAAGADGGFGAGL